MSNKLKRVVTAGPFPVGLAERTHMDRVDASDCWTTALLPGDSRSPLAWAHAIFDMQIPLVEVLMKVRDFVVRPFGVAVSSSSTSQTMFPILSTAADEVILGEDDKHLSFVVAVTIGTSQVSITTLVTVHNTFGKLYWAVVRLFHPLLVRATIRATGLVAGEEANQENR
jgi:hypothetical protein